MADALTALSRGFYVCNWVASRSRRRHPAPPGRRSSSSVEDRGGKNRESK
jgi:hypothetical protein